jgi:hypothetical protein
MGAMFKANNKSTWCMYEFRIESKAVEVELVQLNEDGSGGYCTS